MRFIVSLRNHFRYHLPQFLPLILHPHHHRHHLRLHHYSGCVRNFITWGCQLFLSLNSPLLPLFILQRQEVHHQVLLLVWNRWFSHPSAFFAFFRAVFLLFWVYLLQLCYIFPTLVQDSRYFCIFIHKLDRGLPTIALIFHTLP